MWRRIGFFDDPIVMGYFASVVSVYLLGSTWLTQERQKKSLQFIPAGLAFISFVFSGTRLALMGWLVGMTTYFVLGTGSILKRTAIGLLAVILLGALSFWPETPLLVRLPLMDQAITSRTSVWVRAIPAVLNSPYLGHGLGSYEDFNRKIELYRSSIYEVYPWSESMYVTLAVEAGILGGLLFLLFVFHYISKAFFNRRISPEHRSSYMPAIAATVTWLTCAVGISPFNDVRLMIILFSLLVQLSACRGNGWPNQ